MSSAIYYIDHSVFLLHSWPVLDLGIAANMQDCTYTYRVEEKEDSSLPGEQNLQGKTDSNEKFAWLYKVMEYSWSARLSVNALQDLDLQIGDMQDNINISGNLIKS